MKRITIVVLLVSFAGLAQAQLNVPPASPDAEFKQQIGFGEVEIKYSRPSARGRVIFGGLEPYGQMWRTGAHDATSIRFSEAVKLNGNDIPAGTYSLFTIPNQNEWTIIINKIADMHGTSDYAQEQDLVRFSVKPEKSARYYETFTIEVNDLSKDEAGLFLLWENTQVKITIKMNVDEKVMAEINDRINVKKEDRASLFYQSSSYYFNNNKDLKQAYAWIQIANNKAQDAAYLQLQAKIEAAMNDYTLALKTLKASTDLATTKKLDQVIAANEKLRAEWATKSKK
ncbi:MAG TPA: DUF2911 domain-containing protein [Cyclobacteriaceae bacterium]|nr:DUF2911 domain-containing protein [Cyclobacteriaceae bacterium]HRF32434.1 DUF2911 domain-containing protein [Cyclobacteriaceae bacterium]